jgi:quercetin dioxygenase-like cupin family protein
MEIKGQNTVGETAISILACVPVPERPSDQEEFTGNAAAGAGKKRTKEETQMNLRYLKNIEPEQALKLPELVEYQQGQVVSRTLVQNEAVSITLFSFDKGEEIGTHSSDGDAMLTVLGGNAKITVGGKPHLLTQGQTIVMPAGIPHAVAAESPFKMLLTVVFPSPKAGKSQDHNGKEDRL